MSASEQMISAFRVNRETNADAWIDHTGNVIVAAGNTAAGRTAFKFLRSLYLMQCDAERRRYAYSHG